MGAKTKAKEHLSKTEILERIKGTIGFWKVQRWLVIYNALTKPQSAKNIAESTGLAVGTVHNIISLYNRYGADVIETKGKGGRRRENLSLEREKKFIAKFIKRANFGEVVTAKEIKEEYEKEVKKVVNKSVIYRLLKRHGWRKISPRPQHSKANKQAQITFKKTLKKK